MPTLLNELSSRVLLFVASFRRKAGSGAALSGEELNDEARRLFRELHQTAQRDPVVAESWESATKALVYLVDEVMISTPWEHRGWWQDNTLEKSILNNPQKMRGILFFDELDRARKKFLTSERSHSAAEHHLVDLLGVFYCCLRFGFEGKYAGQGRELERESQQLLTLLSPSDQRDTRAYFEEAYRHTMELPPAHHAVMRMATVVALAVGLAVLFLGLRQVLRNDLLNELEASSEQAGGYFQSEDSNAAE